jgi:hypothetical protein
MDVWLKIGPLDERDLDLGRIEIELLSDAEAVTVQHSRTHSGQHCPRSIPSALVFAKNKAETSRVEHLLGAILPIVLSPISWLARHAAARIWSENGTPLPLLSSFQGLGSLEPGMRR